MYNRAALLLKTLAGSVVSRIRHRCLRLKVARSTPQCHSQNSLAQHLSAAVQKLPLIWAVLMLQSRKPRH